MIVLILPDVTEESQLLARAREGDQQAVMTIYETYFSPIYQFIRLRTGDALIAEDLASDVFVKLVVALRGPNAPRQSLRGWLFRVARSEISDHYGQAKRMPVQTLDEWLPEEKDSLESDLLRRIDVSRVRQVLRMLAPEQQEVVVLRFGQALSLQETADVMGKSISAVKSLQFRALDTLRRIIEGEVADE